MFILSNSVCGIVGYCLHPMDVSFLYCFVATDSSTLENPLKHSCSCRCYIGRICCLQAKSLPSSLTHSLAFYVLLLAVLLLRSLLFSYCLLGVLTCFINLSHIFLFDHTHVSHSLESFQSTVIKSTVTKPSVIKHWPLNEKRHHCSGKGRVIRFCPI